MTDQKDKTVLITADALEAIRRMHDHVALLGRYYGERSETYGTSAASLAHALSHVMLSGFGDARVMRDGPLSLFVNEQGFCYGVIFRERARPTEYAHMVDAPAPCEWTLHS